MFVGTAFLNAITVFFVRAILFFGHIVEECPQFLYIPVIRAPVFGLAAVVETTKESFEFSTLAKLSAIDEIILNNF